MLVLIFKKDISKVKNTLLKWILQNISGNQKIVMANFCEVDFMMDNRFWSRDKGGIG